MLERCRSVEGRDADGKYGEHGLTPSMYRIEAQLEHGHLVDKTEDFALKSPDRFKEKLAKLIGRYPGADPKDLANSIHDAVRYTFIFDSEHYAESVHDGRNKLAEAGYTHIETRPSWHTDEYKGVNSRWRDPESSVMFEVQFHTQQSWEAKQATHDAYEKISNPSTHVKDVERLRAYQRDITSRIEIPPGALEIHPYKSRVG